MSHSNRSLRSAFLVAAAIALGATEARAADVQKDNNQTALNLGTSFVGGSVPTGTDMVVFDSLYDNLAGTTVALGANASFGGFRFGAMSGTAGSTLIIGDTTSYILSLGSGGIDASATNMNLQFGGTGVQTLNITANQTWSLAGGRTLTTGGATAVLGRMTGSGDITLAQSGSGTATFELGADGTGATNYTGSWYIGANVLAKVSQNNAIAWGTGRIYLDGGRVGTGIGKGTNYGSWTWNNDIILQSGGGVIDNTNNNGATRTLTLNTHIAGSGALAFNNVGGATYGMTYLVAGGNSYTGGTTINANAQVRIGTGGVLGSLGTGAIVINSTTNPALSLARTGIFYLGNNISGAGRLDISNSSGGAANASGLNYITGANSYTGITAIYGTAATYASVGSLKTDGTGNLGTGAIYLLGGSLLYTGAADTITRGIGWGGVTTSSIFANGSGALVWNPGSAISANGSTAARTFIFGGTNTGLNTFGGTNAVISDFTGASSLTKTNVGTWVLNQLQTYTGATTIAGGTLRLDFVNGTAGVIKSGNALTFSGTGTLELFGKSATTSAQTLGAITLSTGNATFLNTLNGASGLTLTTGAFTRSAGATALFDSTSGGSIGITNTAANGIVGPWAFIRTGTNTYDYAVPGANNAAAVTALASATAMPLTGGGTGNNYLIDATAANVTSTLSGATAANTIRIANSGTFTTTIALGANALTTSGLLVSGAGTGAVAVSGTGVFGAGSTSELVVNNSSGATLTLSAPLITSAAAAGSFTKTGAGLVVVQPSTGNNVFSGAVSINQGELRGLVPTTAATYTPLGTGAITVNPGATLRMKTSASSSSAITYSNAVNLRDGTLISDDGVATWSGAINSTGWSAIQTVWANKTATFSGVISGSGFIDLTAPGNISFTNAANTFTGHYILKSGTLVLGGVDKALGTAAGLTVGAGATATWDRGSAAATSDLFANTTTSVVSLAGTSGSTATLNLTQTVSGSGTFTRNIPKLTLNYGTVTGTSTLGNSVVKLNGAVEVVAGTTNTIQATAGTYHRAILLDGEVSGAGSLTLNRGSLPRANFSSWIGFRANAVGYSGNISLSTSTATNGFYFFGGVGGWGSGVVTLVGAGSDAVIGDASGSISQAPGAVTTGMGTQASGLGAYGSIVNVQGGATVNSGAYLQVLNSSATAYIGGAEIAGAVTLNGGTLSQFGSYSTLPAFIPYTNATWTVGGSAISTISAPLALNYSGVSFSVGDAVTGTDLLVSGVIRGDKQLTKSGVGTMALTAANTTTGGFNVTAGTLNVGNGGATGDLGSGTTVIGASGTVALNHSVDTAVATTFTGTGTLSKSQGSAIETLSGNLSGFTGTIAVATGTSGTPNVLALASSATTAASSTITVAQYAALRSTSTAAVGNVTLASGGNLQIVAGTPTEASAFFTTSGTVAFVTGSGFVIANTSAIAEGTYRLLNYGSGALTYNGGTDITGLTATALASSRNIFSLSNDTTNKYLNMTVTGVAASLVWNGTLSTWDATQAAGAGTAFTNNGTADYFYNYDAVTFDDTGAASTTIGISGALTPGNITVSGSQNYTFNGTGSLSGIANIVKNGTGTLRLENSGANNLSGTITVNGGKLAVTSAYTLSTGGLILNDGATFASVGAKAIGRNLTAAGAVTFGDATDAGALTFSGTNNLSALTTLTANAATTFSGATSIGTALTFAGTGATTLPALTLAGNTTLTTTNTGGVAISGIVSGAYSLTKDGNGALTLSGANTFSGTTTVTGGTLKAAHASALGGTGTANGGAIFIKGGTLELTFTASTGSYGSATTNFAIRTGNITMGGLSGATSTFASSGLISGNPVGFSLGPGFGNTLTYDATNNGGTATISAYWAAVGTSNAGSTTITVGDSTATDVELDFTGRISNTGQQDGKNLTMVKAGAGTMRISAANYLPGVQVDAGTLIVNHAAALGSSRTAETSGGSANLVTVKGGTLDLNGFSNTIGGLSDGGITAGTILNNAVATASTLSVGSSNANTTFGGLINDGTSSIALVKQGTGTLTLSGANTYSGGTTVSAGTLVVGANTALGSGAVTVSDGTSNPILQLSNGVTVGNAFTLGASSGTASRGMLEVKGTSLGGTNGLVTISAAPTAGTHFAVDSGATFQLLGGISSASAAVTFGAGNYILAGSSSYTTASLVSGSIKLGGANGLASGSTFTMGTGASASTLDLNGYSQANAVTLATGAGGLTITNTSGTAGSVNLANTGNIAFNITGNTALVLSGSGSKNLTGANAHTGGTTVSNGSLDLTSLAGLGTGGLTLSGGNFSLANATGATLGGALAGSGNFTKSGAGALSLGTVSGFTGELNINGGSVTISGTSLGGTSVANGGNQVQVSDGASLAGGFSTARDILVLGNADGIGSGGSLRAGTGLAAGTITTTGTLEFGRYNGLGDAGVSRLSALIGAGAGDADLVNVSGGTLKVWANVNVTFVNGGFASGTYNILSFDTANAENLLTGEMVNAGTYGHTAITLNNDALSGSYWKTTGVLTATVTKANLIWVGSAGSSDVDGATANFKLSTDSTASALLAGDELVFDDSSAYRTVNLAAGIPALGKITVDTTAGYTIAGSGALAGEAAQLVKSGSGTLTLGGANTFGGGVSLQGGTLAVAADAALGAATGGVTLAAGTTLQATDTFELASSRTISLGGNASIAVDAGKTLSYAGAIGGTAGLTKTGNGTLSLSGGSTFGGGTTLAAGTLQLGANNALLATGAVTLNGGTLAIGTTSQVFGALTSSNGTISGTGTITAASLAVTGSLSGTGTLNSGTYSFGDNATVGAGLTLGGAATVGKSTAGTLTVAATLANTGGVSVSNGTLLLTAANTYTGGTTLSGTGVIQVGNAGALGAAVATLALNGGTLSSDSTTARTVTAAGASTIGGNVTFGDATNTGALTLANAFNLGGATRTLSVATGASATLSGVLSNGGLTKDGNGNLTLSGSNTLASTVTVDGGTLTTGHANALGVAANTAVIGSGSANASLLVGFGLTEAHAVSVSASGSGTATFGGAYGATATNTQFNGTLTLGRAVTLLGGSADRFTMSGKITGTGDITIATPGVAGGRVSWNQSTPAAANDFVGNIIIKDGAQLQIGVGTATNNSAIPDASSIYFDAQTNSATINLRLSGTGTTSAESVNALISNTVGAGRVQYTDGTSGTLTIGAGNGSGVFSGVVAGALNIVKTGSGNQTFAGANTYTGTTSITGGTLTLANAGALASSALTLTGSGTLAFDAAVSTFNVASLAAASSGAGYDISLNNNAATPAGITLSVGANNASTTYAGVLSGAGALTKAGTGTLTLSGANIHTGGTNITGGTLALGVGATLGSGPITFSAAAAAALQLTLSDTTAYTLSQDIVLTNPGSALNYVLYKAANATPSLGTLTVSGNISGGGANTVLLLNNSAADSLTSYRLSGNNTFQGTVRLNRGNLLIGAASDLGASGNTLYLDSYQNLTEGSVRFLNDVSLTQSVVLSYATVGINTGAYNVGISGAVSGTHGFQKIGSGTLTLAGAATYGTTSNVTTIAEGTVALVGGANRLSAGTALTLGATSTTGGLVLGDASGAVTQSVGSLASSGLGGSIVGGAASASTLTITGSTTTTFAGTIGGAGSNQNNVALAYAGTGALALSGANTYAGGTSLASGTLRVGNNSALGSGAVTLSGGALSSDSTTARTLANNLAFGGNATLGDATNNGALTINGTVDLGGASRTLAVASAVTFANTVSNGTLVKDGVGTLTLSTANSLTAVTLGNGTSNTSSSGTATAGSGGYTVLGDAGALGSGTVTLKGSQIQAGVAGLTITNALTIDAGALRFSGSNDLTLSGAITLVSGATRGIANYSTTANLTLQSAIDLGANGLIFQGSSAASTVAAKIVLNGALSGASGISTDSTYANRTVELNGATTYTGSTTVAGGTVVIASGSSLASAASVSAGTLKLSNGTRLTSTVTLSSAGRLEMAGGTAGAITVGGGQSLVISGGSNTLTSVAMSGSGSFNASGGTLNVGALSTASATGTSWTIASGATVNALSFSNSWNPSSFTVNGTLNLSSTGANSASAAFNQSTNAAMTIAGTGTINITGGFNSANAAGTITTFAVNRVNIGGGTAQIGFSKAGAAASTIILGSPTAATTIGAFGQNWSASVGLSLGTAGVTFDTLDSVDATTGRTITLSGALVDHTSNVGKLTKAGAGTLILSGANTYTGTTTVNGGTLQLGAGSTTGSLGAGAISIASGATLAVNRSSALTLSNAISGAGTLAYTGTSEVVLSGTNTFSGTLNAQSGKIALNSLGANAGLAAVSLGANGTLSISDVFNGATATIRNLSGSGRVDPTYGAAGTRTLGVDQTEDTTFSGVISDSTSGAARYLGLTKTGNAKLTLSGANTYTGATTVSAGTLEVSGTLGASGSYAGAITNNAALAFTSASNQTLTGVVGGSGSLTKSGNGTLTLDAANTYTGSTTVNGGTLRLARADALDASSALAIGANGTLRLDYALGADTTIGRSFSGSAGTIDLATTGYTTTLSGLSGFTGQVKLSTGSVFDAGASNWTGNIVFAGGALAGGLSNYTGAVTVSGTTLSAASGLPANITLASGGTIDFSGATGSALSTTIQFTGGSLSNASGYTGNINVVGTNVTVAAGSLGGGTLVLGSGTSVNITGAVGNSVTVTGGSITGGQNLTGAISVNSGTFKIGATSGQVGIDQLSGSATLTVGGGTLDLNNTAATNTINYTSGSLENAAAFEGTLNVKSAATLTNAAGSTLGGSIVVNGTGKLTNNGAVTGAVTVQSGGTLAGSGTFNGVTTVQSGGVLSPGNSPGVQTYNGSLVLQGGSVWVQQVYNWTADGTLPTGDANGDHVGARAYDTINFSLEPLGLGGYAQLDLSDAAKTVDGQLVLNPITLRLMTLANWADASGGRPIDGNMAFARDGSGNWIPKDFVIATYMGSALIGDATSITSVFAFDPTGFYNATGPRSRVSDFTLFENTNLETGVTQLTLRVVPEPSTYGIILGGLALAAAAIRRRKRKA